MIDLHNGLSFRCRRHRVRHVQGEADHSLRYGEVPAQLATSMALTAPDCAAQFAKISARSAVQFV